MILKYNYKRRELFSVLFVIELGNLKVFLTFSFCSMPKTDICLVEIISRAVWRQPTNTIIDVSKTQLYINMIDLQQC